MIVNIKVEKSDFVLSHVMTDQDAQSLTQTEQREGVRAICIKDNKLLVIYEDTQEVYGTPGGGIEVNESHHQALTRELKEEVGATTLTIQSYLGYIKEQRIGKEKNVLFCPTQHYYLVDIESFGDTALTDKESAKKLKHTFLPLDTIIHKNNSHLTSDETYSYFYFFQNELFKLLKQKLSL